MTRSSLLLRGLRSKIGRLLLIVASAFAALLVVCVVAETYFRLRYPQTYVPDSGIAADRRLGWDTVPPVTALPLNQGNVPVVHFVGDSFTDRKTWPDEAQQRLRGRGVPVDGFNLGVTGFGTTQEFLKLQQHADRIPPQAVVILFFAWNDLRDNYPYPELFYGPQRASRPYFLLGNGEATLSPVEWSSSLYAQLLRSEVYLRIFNRVGRRFDVEVFRRWPNLPSTLGWRAKVYYEDPIAWHPFYQASQAESPYVQGAYDATMSAFRSIRDLAARHRAALLVIGIDNAFTVDTDLARRFITPHPDLDASLPLKRMARLLQAEGIAFIDAQPALAALGRETGKMVYNGPPDGLAGHLHVEGDRLIGALAAEWLADHLPRR